MKLTLEINPEYGKIKGASYPFEIKNLKETLIEVIRTLDEFEYLGYEPIGIRILENYNDFNKKKLEVYVKNEKRFL